MLLRCRTIDATGWSTGVPTCSSPTSGRAAARWARGAGGARGDRLARAPGRGTRRVDDQIREVAPFLGRPGMGVKEIMGDPEERRGVAAEPRPEAADRAFRGDQPPPGVLIDLRRQAGL